MQRRKKSRDPNMTMSSEYWDGLHSTHPAENETKM